MLMPYIVNYYLSSVLSFHRPYTFGKHRINFSSFSVCNPLQFSSYYDFHILPDHDRHPSAIPPRMPSLELHFRHRKCSPLYFRAPPFPTCLFPHAGGKYAFYYNIETCRNLKHLLRVLSATNPLQALKNQCVATLSNIQNEE